MNYTELHYIGHSQGCTVFFVMITERPEYNSKITSMTALAPAAFVGDIKVVNKLIIDNLEDIEVNLITN